MKKNSVREFFKNKKEVFLFLAILVILLAAIIAITNWADRDAHRTTEAPGTTTSTTGTTTSSTTSSTTTNSTTTSDQQTGGGGYEPGPDPTLTEQMILPIEGDHKIVLHYFDVNNPATLANAVINNGNIMIQSRGMSYAREDNSVFDVLAVFSGEVVSIDFDILEGYTVVLLANDNVTITYFSLSSINVELGDRIGINMVLGQAGESIFNTSAGVHVHIEVRIDDDFVNPLHAVGRRTYQLVRDID
ncbi:MAG: M23 family metallopeptidase [Erysipelotrichales bacterium]|nr:M23 family metallopeptidase [Erysipelotrichales bacterium]